ncbi:hypothetical protein TNCT_3181 [Trichonephila clavata]|uniref:Uncharacterized protein n=1 Tax=Trichonephila clavata TaxID=2740835 RepID=A0A8X6FWR1_TRICU|nr:hypothetical protein TNCT_3181 [Trichonephila clavata]
MRSDLPPPPADAARNRLFEEDRVCQLKGNIVKCFDGSLAAPLVPLLLKFRQFCLRSGRDNKSCVSGEGVGTEGAEATGKDGEGRIVESSRPDGVAADKSRVEETGEEKATRFSRGPHHNGGHGSNGGLGLFVGFGNMRTKKISNRIRRSPDC